MASSKHLSPAKILTRHPTLDQNIWYRVEDEIFCLYTSADCTVRVGDADTFTKAHQVARAWFNGVQANKAAIILLIRAMGPVEIHQILRECDEQAHGDAGLIQAAIDQLVASGEVIRHLEAPPDNEYQGYYSYDLAGGEAHAQR